MTAPNDLLKSVLGRGLSAGLLVAVLERMKGEGRLNEVVQQCIRFLDLQPDDVRLRALLAQSYEEMGFITMAEYEFEKVAAMIDDMASVYGLLADLYGRQQKYEEAADMLRRYLAHHPKEPEALERLKQMEAALTRDKTLPEMKDVEGDLDRLDDGSEDALVDFATPTIAELYYSQGRIDAAVHTYETLIRDRPGDEALMERLEQLKEMLGKSPEFEVVADLADGCQEERMITILERWLPRIREIRYV